LKKSIEEMVEELNKECNESLNIIYYRSFSSWEISSYRKGEFGISNYILAKGFKEVVEKAMKKLGLSTETSQEEYKNAKKKTLEKLIKIAESRENS
jgi:hypothetical protein